MMSKLPVAAAVLVLGSAAATAGATADTSEPRWYGAIDVGGHFPEPINSQSTGPAPDGSPYNWQWRLDNGDAAFLRLGYRAARRLRVELETGFRQARPQEVMVPGGLTNGLSTGRPGEPYGLCGAPSSTAPPCSRPDVRSNAYSALASVIFDPTPERRVAPFVGAGVGLLHLHYHGDAAFSNVTGTVSAANPAHQSLNVGGTVDHLGQFAYQAIAGVSYRAARRLHVDLTYRFLGAEFLRWNTSNTTAGLDGVGGLQPMDFRGALHDSTVTLGARYGF